MKKVIMGIILITLLGIIACGPKATAPTNYAEVSVSTARISIPDDWIRDDEFEQEMESELDEFEGALKFLPYIDKSDSVGLMVIHWDMEKFYDLEGETWSDWEDFELDMGMSKETFVYMMSSLFMYDAENVLSGLSRQLNIGGNEASELCYEADIEGVPAKCNICGVFGEDELVMVIIMAKEVAWSTFEDCWPKIRDSVRIT